MTHLQRVPKGPETRAAVATARCPQVKTTLSRGGPVTRHTASGTLFGTTPGGLMAITTSEARRDLFGLIERVNLDHTEIEITSKRGSAVLMSKDEYDSLVETSYLLRSPENARRLLSALASVRDGKIEEHDLLEP
ncbi:type II toxin-antitoxin system Phd/YefM family antitoxin [Microbacterium sp. NPDC007973]|uniref:type II toxin-antitoxin system Phd/YefM family antitoxin n=1 Tax=Microbacterium sp. NPDC007973 TaxID=3364182 RepID=UPI0036EBD363